MVMNLSAKAGDVRYMGLIPGLGRYPVGGPVYPLQYSCLKHPLNKGAWQAVVHRITKSWIQLKQCSMKGHIKHLENCFTEEIFSKCFSLLLTFVLMINVIACYLTDSLLVDIASKFQFDFSLNWKFCDL